MGKGKKETCKRGGKRGATWRKGRRESDKLRGEKSEKK